MRYSFHANIFALPAGVGPRATKTLRGEPFSVLQADDGRPPTFADFFSTSFEDAMAALVRLPRLDAEPDGFFVMAGDAAPSRWQLDGHLFDFDGRLHRVELHGTCPAEMFDRILSCFGWPETRIAFELVAEGVALDEAAFRKFAAAK